MAERIRPKKRRKKVMKMRKPIPINIGFIVFFVILAYLVIYAIMYFSRERVSIYEVVYGKSADTTNKTYTALLLRNEEVTNAETAGYLNYYVREGQRVCVGETVYTIDESGQIQQYLADNPDGLILNADDYDLLRGHITDFTAKYSDLDFSKTYDFKIDLASALLESANMNAINTKLEELNASGQYNYAINQSVRTGIVEYYSDGYEKKLYTDITSADFDISKYHKKSNTTGSLIEAGAVAYKTINDEHWQVLIPLSQDEAAKRIEDTSIRIKFTEDGNEVVGDFQVITQNDCTFGLISLDKYMVSYASKRYAEVRIMEPETEGLKIPKSSVVKKDFFVLPKHFGYEDEESGDVSFYIQSYDENNQKNIQLVTPTIYYSDDSYYYLDDEAVSKGDVFIKNDTGEIFTIGQTSQLEGVYNVNNGYCVFRRIEKAAESGDYYLINTSTSYGLKVYDHIVINASKVTEKEVVFR